MRAWRMAHGVAPFYISHCLPASPIGRSSLSWSCRTVDLRFQGFHRKEIAQAGTDGAGLVRGTGRTLRAYLAGLEAWSSLAGGGPRVLVCSQQYWPMGTKRLILHKMQARRPRHRKTRAAPFCKICLTCGFGGVCFISGCFTCERVSHKIAQYHIRRSLSSIHLLHGEWLQHT